MDSNRSDGWTEHHEKLVTHMRGPESERQHALFWSEFDYIAHRIVDFNAISRAVTLLSAATHAGLPEAIDKLIARGADPRKPLAGQSLMHIARHPKTIAKLAEIGLDVNERNNKLSPLHRTCMLPANGCVEELLRRGANPNAQDSTGSTPLHRCLGADGGVEARDILLTMDQLAAAGAAVNMKDTAGMTPSHIAADKGKSWAILPLLRMGADLDAEDNRGCRPIHYATASKQLDAVRVLVSLGASTRGVLSSIEHYESSLTSHPIMSAIKVDEYILLAHLKANPIIDPAALADAIKYTKNTNKGSRHAILLSHAARQAATSAISEIDVEANHKNAHRPK